MYAVLLMHLFRAKGPGVGGIGEGPTYPKTSMVDSSKTDSLVVLSFVDIN